MGNVFFNTDVTKTVDITKDVTLTVTKDVSSTVDLTGCLATAEGSADAIGQGDGLLAETDTFAQCTDAGAYSFSESLAAYDPFDLVVVPI
jgi:hypothetical protein